MRTHLLVFDDGSNPELDLRSFVESLDDGAEILTLDGHVCFVKSNLDPSEVSGKFLEFAGSSLFFITEVGSADYAGRLTGPFWDFIKKEKTLSPAA